MKSNYLSHYEHVYCIPVFFPYSDFLLSAKFIISCNARLTQLRARVCSIIFKIIILKLAACIRISWVVKSWHISCFTAQRAHQRARVVSNSDSTMIPYKEKTFDELVVDGLRGSMPGAYSSNRPKSTFNKTLYRNVFSDRARDGFRYWLIERPKPTSCKYPVRKYVIC